MCEQEKKQTVKRVNNLVTVLEQHSVQKFFLIKLLPMGEGETVAVGLDYSRWPFQVGEGET